VSYQDRLRLIHSQQQPTPDPRYWIVEFDVYRLHTGTWRAVHVADPWIVVEDTDWDSLFMACVAKRCARALRHAFAAEVWDEAHEEARQAGRFW
jgi:hypothetical protein